jgi:hypothetical protein
MRLDDSPGDIEAESRAALALSSPVAVEYEGKLLRSDAGARVMNLEADFPVGRLGRDRDLPPAWDELHGISHQVLEDARDALAIQGDSGEGFKTTAEQD